MIYSIGYQRMWLPQLVRFVEATRSTLIDCRSAPSSRRSGFSRKALATALGSRYEWMGDFLGGRGTITEDAIAELSAHSLFAPHVTLLCMEEAPGECHRHHAIALPLLRDHKVDVLHVFKDHAVYASELQRSFDEERDEYEALELEPEIAKALHG